MLSLEHSRPSLCGSIQHCVMKVRLYASSPSVKGLKSKVTFGVHDIDATSEVVSNMAQLVGQPEPSVESSTLLPRLIRDSFNEKSKKLQALRVRAWTFCTSGQHLDFSLSTSCCCESFSCLVTASLPTAAHAELFL